MAAFLLLGAAAPLKVLYPNGGEVLRPGDEVAVRWVPGASGRVVIVLFRDGVQDRVLAAQAPDTGLFRWKLTGELAPGDRYRVRIRSLADLNVNDFSDGDFRIVR